MKLNKLLTYLLKEDSSYRGEHMAPGKEDGAPLHDLTANGIYPADIYTMPLSQAVEHYGHGEPGDFEILSIARNVHNKPNAKVKVYRAVPYVKTKEEEIFDLENMKKAILRRGAGAVSTNMTYDQISQKIDMLRLEVEKGVPDVENALKINPGDWVALQRSYAVDHGKTTLNGKYVVLSKTVAAKDLYTDGNSLQEWGWSP